MKKARPRTEKEEVAEEVNSAQKTVNFIESEGWQGAKRKLLEKAAALDSITTLDVNRNKEELLLEMYTRYHAIGLLTQWIAEVEGDARQARQTLDAIVEMKNTGYISRF